MSIDHEDTFESRLPLVLEAAEEGRLHELEEQLDYRDNVAASSEERAMSERCHPDNAVSFPAAVDPVAAREQRHAEYVHRVQDGLDDVLKQLDAAKEELLRGREYDVGHKDPNDTQQVVQEVRNAGMSLAIRGALWNVKMARELIDHIKAEDAP